MRRRVAAAGLFGAIVGCATGAPTGTPRAQVVVHVDTDAPVVPALPSAGSDWTTPISLFDRVRFEVYPPGVAQPCASCTNEFGVTREDLLANRVSFGVAPDPNDAGWVVRVRLTTDRFAGATGDIDPNTTLDTFVALPPVANGQVLDVTVFLDTSTVGTTGGSLDGPLPPTAGAPSNSRVGTWPQAARSPCSSTAPPGAVCVPGGAFWMGAPTDHFVFGTDPTWHRLVVMSPFWLDPTETTVARARAGQLAVSGAWSGSTAGTGILDFCTYTPTPSSRDVLPVNCMSQAAAEAFCRHSGGTLPTEAQLEYAGGGALARPYPWGFNPPACGDAVWGRNGWGLYDALLPKECYAVTPILGPLSGPAAPMSGSQDALLLPGGSVYDLAGNLYEATADVYQDTSESCWTPRGILPDPTCQEPSTKMPGTHAFRGGAWSVGGTYLEAAHRVALVDGKSDPTAGFRCAWPGG